MIEDLLEKRNMTKYRLASISGIAHSTLSDICNGKTKLEKCSAETIYKLAKALGVTMEFLTESGNHATEQKMGIHAACFEEESNSMSKNIKFGIKQSSLNGHVKLNHTQFLGYSRDSKGNIIVVEEEAKIVRLVFDLYLKGNGCRKIKRYLDEHSIKTVTGKTE